MSTVDLLILPIYSYYESILFVDILDFLYLHILHSRADILFHNNYILFSNKYLIFCKYIQKK